MRNLLKWLREYWYVVTGTFAIVVFLGALTTDPTEKDPSGEAGFFAAMLALCAAAIFIAETANAKSTSIRRAPGIFLGIVTLASAYLWIAAEAGVHPANPVLFGQIGFIWLLCAILAVLIAMMLLFIRKR